jgi:hypothetical protein
MKNYHYSLIRGGEPIDCTSLDEESQELAEELFFGEFGHTKQKEDVVELDSVLEGEE